MVSVGLHDIHCGPKSYMLKLLGKLVVNMVLEPHLIGDHVFKCHYHIFISPTY